MSENRTKIFYRRHLPHYQPPGCTFFVTFRLAGSLPLYVIQKLKSEYEGQLKLISGIQNQKEKYRSYQEIQLNYFEKFDTVLDKYKESVSWLNQPAVAQKVKEAIHYSGRNGVPACSGTSSTYIVAKILQDLKKYTAVECNKILNRSGAFWQHESYDHVVRDEDELSRIIEYVLNNPVKTGLVDKWDDWKWGYCKFVVD